jgi:hypothetical protein
MSHIIINNVTTREMKNKTYLIQFIKTAYKS